MVILETTGGGYSSSPRADGHERSGGRRRLIAYGGLARSAFVVRLRVSGA